MTALGTYSGYAVPTAPRSQKKTITPSSVVISPSTKKDKVNDETMKICPFCNEIIPDGVNFCPSCGKSLKRTCPQCGAETDPTYKFCPHCGHCLQENARPKQDRKSDLLTNPVFWGITLGKTTLEEARSIGLAYDPKYTPEKKNKQLVTVFNVSFWDHDNDGIIEYIYYTEYDHDFPEEWNALGFNWDNSYAEWRQLFMSHKFSIHDDELPHIESAKGIGTFFSANFTASSKDKKVSYTLNFNYKDKSRTTSDKSTLYAIRISVSK